MADETIPINSGTGPHVAVDLVGTNNYQIVKILQTDNGAIGTLGGPWLVTNTGVFTVTASGVTIAGTVTVTGGGGGQQYAVDSTALANTGTGNLILGMQSGATTARGIAVTTTGAAFVNVQNVVSAANVTIASITTGTVSIVGTPAVTAANVTIASVTTGTMNVVNVVAISGTVTGIVAASGTQDVNVVNVLSASGVTVASIATGTVDISNASAVNRQYVVDTTAMAATATGTVILGMQSGATTARGLAITTTGAAHVSIIGTPAVTAANVTIASVTTGTMNVINVLSASGVTIASVTTGTMNVVNVLSATGVLLGATDAVVGSVVGTAHSSRWDAYAVNTTSGASVIVKTSGAHTLYITDMVLSVDVPSRVDIFSAATTKMSLYLATKGGFTVALSQPMVLNSNQSLTFTPSASGSAMLFACGFTVT